MIRNLTRKSGVYREFVRTCVKLCIILFYTQLIMMNSTDSDRPKVRQKIRTIGYNDYNRLKPETETSVLMSRRRIPPCPLVAFIFHSVHDSVVASDLSFIFLPSFFDCESCVKLRVLERGLKSSHTTYSTVTLSQSSRKPFLTFKSSVGRRRSACSLDGPLPVATMMHFLKTFLLVLSSLVLCKCQKTFCMAQCRSVMDNTNSWLSESF
jgi:hypothetical protein